MFFHAGQQLLQVVEPIAGFLGAFLIKELIERTEATVHCLVRADDEATGLARLSKLGGELFRDVEPDAVLSVPERVPRAAATEGRSGSCSQTARRTASTVSISSR